MEDTTPTTTTTTTLHLGPQWARQGGSLAQMMKNSNEVSEAPPQKTKTFIRPPVYDKEKMLSCHRDVGVPEGMNLIEGVTTKECLPPVSLTVLTSEQRNAFWSRRRPRGKSGEGQGLRKTTTTTTGGGMDGRWSSKETVSSRWGGEQRERRPWTPGSVEAKSSRGKNELWEDAGTRESASSSLEKMAKQAQEFEAMKAAAKAKMKAEKAARSTMTTSNETTTIPTPVLFGDRSPVSPVVTQLAPVPHENAWSSALNKHQHEQQQWSQATRSRPAPATQQQQQQPSWTGNTSTTTTSSNAWGASTRQQQQQSVVPRPHHHQQQQQPLRQQPITTTYASQRQEPPRVIQQQQQWQQQQQQQQYSRSSPTPPTLPIPLDMNTPQWWYQDPHGRTQGPFPGMKMIEWVRQGFFKRDLPVRFRNHTEFRPLGVLFPNNQTMFTHVPESIVQQQSNTRRRGSPSLSPKLHSQQPPQQSLPSKATWGTTSSSSSSTTKKTNADTRTLMSALHIEPKQQQQQDAALHAAFVATSAQISAQNVVRTLPAQNVTTKQMQQQAWNNEKKKQPTMVDIQREERRRAAMEAKRLEEERAKRQQEQQKQPSTNASPWGMKKQAPKVKSFMEIQAEEEKRELAMRKARQNEAMESSRRTQGQTMAQRLGSNSSRANLQKWTTGAAPTTEQQASVQIQNKKTLIPATTKPAVKSLMEVQAEQLKEQKERRPRRGNAASWSNITSSSSSNSQSQQKTGWNRDATRTAPQETKSLLEIQAEEARKRASSRQQGGPSRNSWLQAAGGSESRQGISSSSSSSSTTIETSQSNSGSVGVDSFWNGVLTESGDVKSTTEIRSTRTTSSHSYTDTNRKSAKDRRGRNNTRQSSGNRHQNMNKNTTTSSTTTSENQSLSSSASTSSKSNSSKKKGSEDFGSKMPRSMVSWCKSQLSKITNSDDETLVRFCFTLDSPADIREYMRNYMGSTPQVSAFASEFIRRKNRSKGRSSGSNNNNKSTNSTSRRGGRRGRGGRGGRGGRRK